MGYNLDTSSLPPHTILRGRIYYFQLRVPKQHQQAYGPLVRARLSECGKEAAILAASSFAFAQTSMAIKHQS